MSKTERITNEVCDRHMAAQMFTDSISKLTPQQREQAANLIEAAPDMYEALKECEEYFDSRADADHNGDRYVGNAEMDFLILVRAALAKAKGRQP